MFAFTYMPEFEQPKHIEHFAVDTLTNKIHNLIKDRDWYQPEYGKAIANTIVECGV
jgi:hypothetical protein